MRIFTNLEDRNTALIFIHTADLLLLVGFQFAFENNLNPLGRIFFLVNIFKLSKAKQFRINTIIGND